VSTDRLAGLATGSVRFGTCRKNAQTKAAIRPTKARPYRPPAKLPVRAVARDCSHDGVESYMPHTLLVSRI
jgi:hypothetical protein